MEIAFNENQQKKKGYNQKVGGEEQLGRMKDATAARLGLLLFEMILI